MLRSKKPSTLPKNPIIISNDVAEIAAARPSTIIITQISVCFIQIFIVSLYSKWEILQVTVAMVNIFLYIRVQCKIVFESKH